jgi:hypothetical protein
MNAAAITPIKVAGIIAPILRPLPTLFAYARVTADPRLKIAPALQEEFEANLRALATILDRVGKDAQIPASAMRAAIDRCISLAQLQGTELAGGLDQLCAALTSLHQEHGKGLRKAVAGDPERYRELYRSTAPTKTVLVFHSDESPDESDSLERKLTDRCYYDCHTVVKDWNKAPFHEADFVVFAPSKRPIEANIMAIVDSYKLPFLILMGSEKTQDQENMALMKSEFLYRKSGYDVLRNPFNPPRLYHTIDAIYMRHLASKVLAIPVIKPSAAAAAEAASGQG